MVSAQVRRQQVRGRRQKGLSLRRSCALLRVARSTITYEPRLPARDRALGDELKKIARRFSRYGYRRAWAELRRRGVLINHQRVDRVWRKEGLALERRRKRRRPGPRTERPPVAQRGKQVWAYDFAHDRCANGQKLKCLVLVDEFTWEILAIDVAGRIDSARVIAVLSRLVQERGAPEFVRSDNGPELVVKAVRGWLEGSAVSAVFIEPGKPWQNGVVESVIGKVPGRVSEHGVVSESGGSSGGDRTVSKRVQRKSGSQQPGVSDSGGSGPRISGPLRQAQRARDSSDTTGRPNLCSGPTNGGLTALYYPADAQQSSFSD